ncbi:MAG: GAF domain-containing protein [Chloroflexi bacterium]|nr:GAF domain-containing protein [Chloroflexota bacterium]
MAWKPARRRSIGSRIFIGYGVIMALAMGFMLVIVALLVSANTRQVDALERLQRLETNKLRLQLAVQGESDAVNAYLLRGDEVYLANYREAVPLHQAALDELQSLAVTSDDDAALQLVRERYLAFLIEANRQIDTYREESKEASIAAWQTVGSQRKLDLLRAIDAFVQTHRRSIDTIVAGADEGRQNSTLLMSALLVIAGASVVLSGRRLTRSITMPVGHLVDVASSFSQGHLSRRAVIASKDELATLAQVMNAMATNLAQSRTTVQASLRETEERNRQLATLNSLAGALSQSLDLRVILERALDHVLALSATERGWVWLVQDDDLAAAPLVTRHMSPDALAALADPAARDYVRAVARQGEVIVKPQPSPLAHGMPDGGPTGRSILVPLATRDRALGVMALSGSTPLQDDAANMAIFQALGRQIAVGIENARLFSAEQRLTREALGLADTARLVSGTLELDDILPIIARSAVALLAVDRSIVFLFEQSRPAGRAAYIAGRAGRAELLLAEDAALIEAILRRHAGDDAAIIVNDVALEPRSDVRDVLVRLGTRSALAVALQARGRTLGALYVGSVERRREFSAHDQRVALALADQAAVSIEAASLYAGVQERAGQLAGLYEIGKVIAATLDQEELCEVLYRETKRLMDADSFEVALASPTEDIQRIVFRVDGDQRIGAETVPAAAGLSGHVMRQRQPLLATRAEIEALGIQSLRSSDPEGQAQSVLCAPLTREGKVLGAISTRSYRPQAYNLGHLELFEAIANQAAIAVENSELQRRALDLAVVEERNRLARELHDSVTQMLFSITLTLQAGRVLLQRNAAQAEQQMEKAQQTAQEALAEMRALIYQLRPASLRERGLIAALTSYIDVFQQRTGLDVTWRHEGDVTFSEAQEQAIFRIVQEALNNVVKHAEARHVDIHLLCEAATMTLVVIDDGRGMPAGPPTSATPTWGILGMRERAEVLGGTFSVAPAPAGGVEVRVVLPVAADQLASVAGRKETSPWRQ